MVVVVHNTTAVLNGVQNHVAVQNPELVQDPVLNTVRSMQMVSSTERHHKLVMYGVIQTEVAGKTALGVQQAVPAGVLVAEPETGNPVVAMAVVIIAQQVVMATAVVTVL